MLNKNWVSETLWYDYFKLIITTQKSHILESIHKNVNIDVNHMTISVDDRTKIFIDVIVIRIKIIDILWLSVVVVIVVVIIVTIIDEFCIERLSIIITILLSHNLNNKLSDELNELSSLSIEKFLTLIIEFELTSHIKLKEIKIKVKLFLTLILCVEKNSNLRIEKTSLTELKFEFWHDDILSTYFFSDVESWCSRICVREWWQFKKILRCLNRLGCLECMDRLRLYRLLVLLDGLWRWERFICRSSILFSYERQVDCDNVEVFDCLSNACFIYSPLKWSRS